MGTDIHMAVERRNDIGEWERVLPPESARVPWLVEQARKATGTNKWYARRAEVTWFDDRNYRLFAILANVRNGFGFAGCDMGDPVIPIAHPRGLPGDLSPACQRLIADDRPEDDADVDFGDHSESWLTLAELDAYNWLRPIHQRGVIPFEEFTQRIRDGDTTAPKEYSGDISGQGVRVLTRAAAIEALVESVGAAVTIPEGEQWYVREAWTEPAAEEVGRFTAVLLPELRKLHTDPSAVRIVFGFDS